MNKLLMIVGLLSLFFAAVYVLRVKNVKRMFAYSSMEHASLVMIAFSCGGLGYFAAILHLVMHSLVKSSLFFQVSQMHRIFSSKLDENIGSYLRVNPLGGLVMLLGFLSIIAMPPSGMLISELYMFQALVAKNYWWVALIVLLLVLIIIYGLAVKMLGIIFLKKNTASINMQGATPYESIMHLVLIVIVFYIGLFRPDFIVDTILIAIQTLPRLTMETTITASAYFSIKNQQAVNISKIPVSGYDKFYAEAIRLLNLPHIHCVNYFAYEIGNLLKFICCLADDQEKDIKVLSHEQLRKEKLQLHSITREIYAMHIFEREISENFGVEFIHSPWTKPVRYAFNRADKTKVINNYPFYKIHGDELHEVGVGPIHAGVIEPGHFRFLCNGETVLHLEIQLGWQHRGVEDLFLKKSSLLQRTILSESIAGDTAVGHSAAFVLLTESMSSLTLNKRLETERTIALELERIAMHVGDLGNMNIGLAYQLASSVFGTLRTPVINYTQTWCGNRFGKGLNRVGGTHYPLTEELIDKLVKLLDTFEKSFKPMSERFFSLSSALMRMENIGKVSRTQMQLIGAVGMAARMTGIPRDVRISHPSLAYKHNSISSDTLENGDVWARAYLRKLEIENSVEFIRHLISELKTLPETDSKPLSSAQLKLATHSLGISLVEGWRGEICHCAITDDHGDVIHYKVKDPSMHNWMALALSLRDLEISDFPINNKSFNLSYCGHDL